MVVPWTAVVASSVTHVVGGNFALPPSMTSTGGKGVAVGAAVGAVVGHGALVHTGYWL